MESRLSIRGNACAPVLVMFPLGLLTVAVLFDVFQVLGGPRFVGTLAYCTVAAGLVGGTVTALAVRIDEVTAGRRPAGGPVSRRFLLDGAVLVVFAVILLLRMRTPERTAGPGLVMVELLGLSLAAVGGLTGAVPRGGGRARTGPETVRLAQIFAGPAAPSSGTDEAAAWAPPDDRSTGPDQPRGWSRVVRKSR
jgi:uncharacterized membrane protein